MSGREVPEYHMIVVSRGVAVADLPGPVRKACEQPGERHVRDAKYCCCYASESFSWVQLLFGYFP